MKSKIPSTESARLEKRQKRVTFWTAFFLAMSMCIFEIQKTSTINLEIHQGIGHAMLLIGLSIGGLVLFWLGGSLWRNKTYAAIATFAMSVALRFFFGAYIEILNTEGVFVEGERWTMHAGNAFLSCVELAFSFTQTKARKVDELSTTVETVNKVSQELKTANGVLKNKLKAEVTKSTNLAKDLASIEELQETTKIENENLSNQLEDISGQLDNFANKVETMQIGHNVGSKLANKFVSMNGNMYMLACGSCGSFHMIGRNNSDNVSCECGTSHSRTEQNTITKNSILELA